MTALEWTTHFLTHVDPPSHFIKNGASLDDLPLDRFFGRCRVVEIADDCVSRSDIEKSGATEGMTLLLKTKNSSFSTESPFRPDYAYVLSEAAEAAVKLGLNMVGIDYVSIDAYGDEKYPAHHILLGGNVLILEGLDLSAVAAGEYHYSALPLKIKNGDGSPVRAVLIAG